MLLSLSVQQTFLTKPRQLLSTLAAVVYKAAREKFVLLYVFLFISLQLSAQFTITIQLKSVPSAFTGEPVFAVGTFNDWNPDLQKFSFINNILTTGIEYVKPGKHEFKFTRGSWKKVECDAKGKDIANRIIDVHSDTTILCSIEGWIDDAGSFASLHTASKNVQVMAENFEMPLLEKFRHIWVYLPPGYDKSKTRYPVLYMQDGQNVFDEYTAPFGEWGVDECLDSLIEKGKPGCIVVAIETGGMDRMSEYNPFEFTWKRDTTAITFPPKADDYLTDIATILKPFIDKKYRTLASKENTIIAGSSMGGLLAFYAAVKYPDVFGKAGVFSPAFWTASGIDALTDSLVANLKGKYFFYMGGKEGEDDLLRMISIKENAGSNSTGMFYSVIDPEGEHKEKYWRKWFAEFYSWIMADGFNVNSSLRN